MGTGENLTASERVQRLQRALHAKAKEAPDFRFYSLCDKVWRADVLAVAWQAVRRNGGAAGVDGETVADVESLGVDQWLGALARDLKEGTYRPRPVRQVLIPKKQRGKFRPLGIPCLRDRVAQTAAMLVLSPIFEADLHVRDREETPNSGLVSTARCCGGRGIVRPTGSACARRRQGASLRSAPAFAGLTALTPAPRTPSRLALV